ncbi:MAG: TMEM165/GDT1 family protein [Acidimicrobiia bacterium]|nr:TMEM165/GDT1 family protein [Acidimicrobiia bacterium]
MSAALVSLGVVFVAELGDKTQLVVLAMGARHRPAAALAALAATAAALMALAVAAGALLGSALPERAVAAGAGVLFLAFALWSLRELANSRDAGAVAPRGARGLLPLVTAFFVAELGDKTQLTAGSLAARGGALGTWVGATLGLVGATAIALGAGRLLSGRLSERALGYVAAVAFTVVGVASLVVALRP